MDRVLNALRNGRPVLVHDDKERENEVDIILPAARMTPEWMAFAIEYGTGLCCVALPYERLVQLEFTREGGSQLDNFQTAFTNKTDYTVGTTTGVSAYDRCATVRALADNTQGPQYFSKSGHILPLVYKPGGLLARRGHTEAAVDLCLLSEQGSAGFLTELQNKDGTMTSFEQASLFATEHGLELVTIQEIVDYLKDHVVALNSSLVTRLVSMEEFYSEDFQGPVTLRLYDTNLDFNIKYILVKGDVRGKSSVLTRVHSECFTADILGSLHCDCRKQLRMFYSLLNDVPEGVLIYLRGQEGRGIGPVEKIKAYNLQKQGYDTVDANKVLGHAVDLRSYWQAVEILKDLGVKSINLCTNNPDKIKELEPLVQKHTSLWTNPNPHNERYLNTKKRVCGHLE